MTKRLIFALALIAAIRPPVAAAPVTMSPLKAVFLVNFASFTTWSPSALAGDAPLVFCVSGDEGVAQVLEEASRDKMVAGHHLVVRHVSADDPVRTCHVLYVSGLNAKQTGKLLERVKNLPMLLISDLEEFQTLGGAITFFVEDNRLRFAINVEATRRSGLHLSAKLLSLAKIVKDP